MFVKPGHRQDDPALPLIVRGPNKRLLSPQGEHAPEITFWHRRVRDGDVVLAEPPPPPPPQPRPPAAVAVVPPVVNHAASRAAADAFAWHLPPAAGKLEHLAGEPLRLTAAEWARLPAIEPRSGSMCREASAALDPPSGPAVEGFAVAAADPRIKSGGEHDPAAALLTHDEPSGQSPEGMPLAETKP
jgi:hypothetical protein